MKLVPFKKGENLSNIMLRGGKTQDIKTEYGPSESFYNYVTYHGHKVYLSDFTSISRNKRLYIDAGKKLYPVCGCLSLTAFSGLYISVNDGTCEAKLFYFYQKG